MNKVDLSSYENYWYKPGNPLKRLLWLIVSSFVFETVLFPFSGFKATLLRVFGAKVSKGLVIKPRVQIKYPWFLEIGENVWIGEYSWIDNLAMVRIGDNVCLSQGAMLLTGNHNYAKKGFDLIVEPIVVENGAWVGAKSLVCPGVKMGSHSVLSVNSVATSNLEAYGIYQGNPAVKIRDRIIS